MMQYHTIMWRRRKVLGESGSSKAIQESEALCMKAIGESGALCFVRQLRRMGQCAWRRLERVRHCVGRERSEDDAARDSLNQREGENVCWEGSFFVIESCEVMILKGRRRRKVDSHTDTGHNSAEGK